MANLPYDISDNPTFRGVQTMIEVVREVARGERDLALCCSTTGIGKTFIVREECRHLGIRDVPEGRPATFVAGNLTTGMPDLDMQRMDARFHACARTGWHRVEVGLHRDAALLVHPWEHDLGQIEALSRA